ncbi:MAG: hypothetical protein R2867_01085 [Caldilineaceae bacterium]
MGQEETLAEAENLLERAWRLREQISVELQSHIADYFAEWCIRQDRGDDAQQWLDRADERNAQIQRIPALAYGNDFTRSIDVPSVLTKPVT